MKLDKDDILKSILEHISDLDYIKTADIPNIELYMDQVTTFMDSQMASSKRYPDDKVLTKTMINNYAKNHLLPSPNKDLYNEVFGMEKEQVEYLKKDLMEKYQTASQSFAEAEEKDREFLTMFSFICLLSFDVYMKKAVIERLVDQLPKPDPKHDKKKKETP